MCGEDCEGRVQTWELAAMFEVSPNQGPLYHSNIRVIEKYTPAERIRFWDYLLSVDTPSESYRQAIVKARFEDVGRVWLEQNMPKPKEEPKKKAPAKKSAFDKAVAKIAKGRASSSKMLFDAVAPSKGKGEDVVEALAKAVAKEKAVASKVKAGPNKATAPT